MKVPCAYVFRMICIKFHLNVDMAVVVTTNLFLNCFISVKLLDNQETSSMSPSICLHNPLYHYFWLMIFTIIANTFMNLIYFYS